MKERRRLLPKKGRKSAEIRRAQLYEKMTVLGGWVAVEIRGNSAKNRLVRKQEEERLATGH